MKDEWRSVVGYEENYEVSSFGGVKNKKSKLFLKPSFTVDGYMVVSLWLDGVGTNRRIHRLVAHAFIENSLNKPQINHKNGVKYDNRVENLEWVTNDENMAHAVRTGLITRLYSKDPKEYKKEWTKNKLKENPNYYRECNSRRKNTPK